MKSQKLINRMLSAKTFRQKNCEPEEVEKKISVNGKEYVPWSMYIEEKSGSLENYPEYPYLEFHFYLYDEIIEPNYYTEVFNMLRMASSGDIFHMYINSPGGDMSTLCSFAAAIEETDALVISHVDGSADSAAFILALIADEVFFGNFSEMMSHNISLSTSSMKVNNISDYIVSSTKRYQKMLKKYGKKILTDDEIERICNGAELYLTSDECVERITNWKKEQEELEEKCSEEHCECEKSE